MGSCDRPWEGTESACSSVLQLSEAFIRACTLYVDPEPSLSCSGISKNMVWVEIGLDVAQSKPKTVWTRVERTCTAADWLHRRKTYISGVPV